MIFPRVLFHYVSITVLLIMDAKVETYQSGCSGGYCFVIYHYNNNSEPFDQSTAQQRCKSNGALLLIEIRNKDIQDSLVTFIRSAYREALIGLNVLTNGKRSSNNWIRLNDNGIGGLSIDGQTNASYNSYGYLKPTISGFAPFASRPTDNKGGFICSDLPNCSGGITINEQCYKSFTDTLSWYDARNRCLDGGGDLASFDQITSNAGFKALNGSWINTSNSYWIGIRRESWTWQGSSSDVKYSDWISGHPFNDQDNTDCLCLSPTEWHWIECSCSQQMPFICFSASVNNSTTPSTPRSTTRSTTTAFTSASKVASLGASENVGLTTAFPGTMTSNSTPSANDTENLKQSMRLSREAAIGIGVGVGIGGALFIAALIAAVIVLCKNRDPIRCLQKKNSDTKVRLPQSLHVLAQNSKNIGQSFNEMENPYALVVPSSSKDSNASTNSNEDSSQTSAIYAQLGFCADPKSHRNGSVKSVPNKSKPSLMPKPPTTVKKFNVGDTTDAEVTVV